ncbi:MAG: polysaccharide pyruvyl transferase family protein [Acidimicrobiia bacterium]
MPILSVCIFTDQPSDRLATMLAPLREVADEIVVAVDDRSVDPRLDRLDGVADVTSLMPFRWPLEANLESLHALCSGDWILRLDGDEVPSAELLRTLAAGAWRADVTHCGIVRKWLVDDGDHWIAQNPWYPDVQWRLYRNDPDLLSYSNLAHSAVQTEGPSRVLTAPIYHLDLVDTPLQVRQEKARRYFRNRPELRTQGGLAMSSYYTPELAPGPLRTEPVPHEDRAFIAAVRTHEMSPPPLVLQAVSPCDPVATGGGRSCSVEVAHVDDRGYRSTHLEVLVTITNTGTEPFGPTGAWPIRIGAQWMTAAGELTGLDETRVDLEVDLGPGQAATVLMLVRTPPTAGAFRLSVGALIEGVEWVARAPIESFTSVRQPTVTMVGGYSIHRHLGDDLITRAFIERITDGCPDATLVLLADEARALEERFGVPAVANAAAVHAGNTRKGLFGEMSVERALRAPSGSGDTEFAEAIRESTAFVIVAAGSLASRYADSIIWPRLIEAESAHAAGVPVVVVSSGLGPFTNQADRAAVRRLLGIASRVFLRDSKAQRAALGLGIDSAKLEVLPDAASGIEPALEPQLAEFMDAHGLTGQEYLVASVRADDSSEILSLVAQSIIAASSAVSGPVVLMPHCASIWIDDRPALKEVAGMLPDGIQLIHLDDIPADIVAADLVRNAAASVGTRFHNGVLSASVGRPSVIVCADAYDRLRAGGLRRTPKSRIVTVSRYRRGLRGRIRRAFRGQGKPVRTPDPDPATAAIVGYLAAPRDP